MSEHNHIKQIIEEALDSMLVNDVKKEHREYRAALRDHIFARLADKYSNETVYARTQSIDLQLKVDVARELRPAMDHLDRHFPGTQKI